ncbi:MAG: winged helix-turn-helix transcriptional regulator [Blastocatellia bacterium]|nr:winged helix-turn-helix transcriptional regulator [Blastocatellia bacterium]
MDLLEEIFKALSDRTRLRILSLLQNGEVCVCDIHESLQIPQPKASRHLAYLKRAGLVEDRKEGLWVYYKLSQPTSDIHKTILSSLTLCLSNCEQLVKDKLRFENSCCQILDEKDSSSQESAATFLDQIYML